jgi:hypothetical protein
MPPLVITVHHNDTTFVSQLVPSAMVCGQKYVVGIVMRNTGTTAWTRGKGYRLGHCGEPHTPDSEMRWDAPRVLLPIDQTIAPGEQALFRFEVTAPAHPGNHSFQFRMLQESVEWFGEKTRNVLVTCQLEVEWPHQIEVVFSKLERLIDLKLEDLGARTSSGEGPSRALRAPETNSLSQPKEIPGEMAAEIDAKLANWNRIDSPGCVLAYVEGGELVYGRGFGMADLDHELALSIFSVFPAGSIAKQFTAFAVFSLIEQGRLSLDDPLRLHIPEFPVWGSSITVGHLLYHTSGIKDEWALLLLGRWREDADSPDQKMHDPIIRQEKQTVSPGECFIYSHTGYVLLEFILQRIVDAPIDDYLRNQLFRPVGMHDTRFYHSPLSIVKGRVRAYQHTDGGHFKSMPLEHDISVGSSLFTTAADMARWACNFHD